MRRIRCASASALLLFAAAAAHAGTVYVPFPGLTQVGGAAYEAEVAVANTAGAVASVQPWALAAGSDGTQRPGPAAPAVPVQPGRTTLIKPSPLSFTGLLELNGPPELRFAARMTGKGTAGALGVALPVITSSNLAAAGKSLALQGLVATSSRSTRLFLVNLTTVAAQCTVGVTRADGSANGANRDLSLPPLSLRAVEDLFSLADQTPGLLDARAQVSCSRDFFTFALLTDTTSGELAVVEPSGSGESSLGVPGAPGACPTGTHSFSKLGVVHQPTAGTPTGRVSFPAPVGEVKRLCLSLEVTVSGFYHGDPDGKHLVYWFVRDKNIDMMGMLFFRGPDAFTALARHGIGLTHPNKLKVVQPFQAIPGRSYRVVHDYDMAGGALTITITEISTGQVAATLVGAPNVSKMTFKAGNKLLVDMGFAEGRVPDEVPSWSSGPSQPWVYRDVRIEVFR